MKVIQLLDHSHDRRRRHRERLAHAKRSPHTTGIPFYPVPDPSSRRGIVEIPCAYLCLSRGRSGSNAGIDCPACSRLFAVCLRLFAYMVTGAKSGPKSGPMSVPMPETSSERCQRRIQNRCRNEVRADDRQVTHGVCESKR